MAEIGLAGLDSNALVEFITAQRWYGSKTREIAHVRIVDEAPLRTGESPLCSIAVAEVRFHPGTHEMYQLLLGARPVAESWQSAVIGEIEGWTVYDALADATLAHLFVDLMHGDTTLGVLQRFVVGGTDGWDFAQDSLAGDAETFLATVGRLGVVTGALHTALASDPTDPSFTPEVPSVESLGLLVASVDEEIERVFLDLPEDDDELAPIIGRGEEVREQLRLLSLAGSVGRVI